MFGWTCPTCGGERSECDVADGSLSVPQSFCEHSWRMDGVIVSEDVPGITLTHWHCEVCGLRVTNRKGSAA